MQWLSNIYFPNAAKYDLAKGPAHTEFPDEILAGLQRAVLARVICSSESSYKAWTLQAFLSLKLTMT